METETGKVDTPNRVTRIKRTQTALSFCKEHPRLWRVDAYKLVPTLVNSDPQTFELHFEVNVKVFESMIAAGKEVIGIDLIAENVRQQRTSKFTTSSFKDPHIPQQKGICTRKQPPGFKPELKLYKYQLDVISWMKSVEEDKDEGIDFCYLEPWKKAQSSVLFDLSKTVAVPIPVSKVSNYVINIKACGGVLGDEMGLGKTMEMIGLILANPGTPIEDVAESEEGASNIKDEEEVEERDETGEKEGEGEDDKDTAAVDDLFATDATLVMCPSHLVHQWTEEIQKRTTDMFVLTTVGQVKAYKYYDVKYADVVIASYQLLKNPQYFHFGHAARGHIRSREERERWKWVNAQLKKVRQSSYPLRQSRPILDHFHWRRIIFDEGHEFIDDWFFSTLLENLRAEFKWIVSGTPFPNRQVAKRISKLLLTAPPDSAVVKEDDLIELVTTSLYWRNTKDSVKDEYKIPPLVEDLVLLDFTDTELISYTYSNESMQRQLCCSHGFGSLTEYKQTAISTQEGNIENAENTLRIRTQQLESESKKLKNPSYHDMKDTIEYDIAELQKDIAAAKETIRRAKECIRLLKAIKPYNGPNLEGSSSISLAGVFDAGNEMEDESLKTEDSKETSNEKKRVVVTNDSQMKEDNDQEMAKVKEAKESMKGANEQEEQAEDLTKAEIDKMTVAQLTKALKKYKIEAPPKALKKALQDLLITHFSKKDGIAKKKKVEEEEKPVESAEAEKSSGLTKKEIETMTVAQLKAALNKLGAPYSSTAQKKQLQESLVKLSTETETKADPTPKKVDEAAAEEVSYTTEEIEGMTVAQLNAALKKKGVEVPKALKKALQDLLKNACAHSATASSAEVKEAKEETTGKRKATSEEAPTTPKKAKVEHDAEDTVKKEVVNTPSKHQKFVEAQALKYLIERYGTKLGNFIQYLKKLWTDDPSARVIIFSQFPSFLRRICDLLADNEIESAFVEGNIMRREKALKSFKKKDSDIRVILLSLDSAASGSNLIEATHIILMDPVAGTRKEAHATESQAIGRAHRQGQNNQITIVRFIIKKTVEYTTYVKNYLTDENLILQSSDPSRPKLVHSNNSIEDILANTPTIRRNKSLIDLVSSLQ